LRTALLFAALFAVFTFLIHLAGSLWGSHLGYGFFRDELYFLYAAIILRGATSISLCW
jgi:hypothetical protein